MYKVIYDDGYWWISKDGTILKEIGGFTDPISPEIIIEEMEYEI